jgi:Ca-activated chloride channel homolog
MTFADPERLWWLLMVPVLAGILVALAFARRRKRALLCDAGLWDEVLTADPFRMDLVRAALLSLGFACLVLALSRPQWGYREVPVPAKAVDVLVAVDVSKSMLTRDVPPDRLSLVRKEVRTLMDSIAQVHVGLLAFAGQAHILVPVTQDLSAIGSFLDVLSPDLVPIGGTDLGAAIEGLGELGRASTRRKVALLFTDGGDLEGRALDAAKRLQGKGIELYIVGVGGDRVVPILLADGSSLRDKEGNIVTTKLEKDALEELAAKAGGSFLQARGVGFSLGAVLGKLRSLSGQDGKDAKDGMRLEAIERSHWFAALAGLFLILELCLPACVCWKRSRA